MTAGDKRMTSSLATIELLPAGKGTDLIFTEQSAFSDGAHSAKEREEGYRGLLEQLGKELQNA
jgi:hypothetical protein